MIFYPSTLQHRVCQEGCDIPFPETFSLLCWNVHKKNRKDPRFKPLIQKLAKMYQLHLCLFQEAELSGTLCSIGTFAYDTAANLEINQTFYGVLSACRTTSTSASAYLSKSRESLIGTHKSLLRTTYPLQTGEELLIFNIHAINFRAYRTYGRELTRLSEKIASHKGPMIIAGDFNTWNKKRVEILSQFCQTHHLKTVELKEVKSFMGYPLDFVLYRGMECVEKIVIADHDISDHHPLLVKFKILN
jgi:endonuclease/exonuclease/phosphatase (EEP) superfamily protein YafD